MNISLSAHDIVAAEKELCRRSLAFFVQRAWHVLEPSTPLKWNWHLDAICMHLEAVTDGRIRNLLINVSPGSMKSLLVGVFWPAWQWGPKDQQHLRFVGTAHEENLAVRDNRRCRDVIKSEWFQSFWPIYLRVDLDGKREFGNAKTGIRQARSFTSMTGVRGDVVILDDPLSASNANSAARLEEAKITFLESLPTRINSPETSSIVVIMQRLHEMDVSGVILDLGLPYEHLCIPMRFEPDRRCRTSIGWEDPRAEDGELMFPDHFDETYVHNLETSLGVYGTAGQLQQRPSPRGGGIFKDEWWKFYQALPVIQWRQVYADTAQKTKTQHDYSVFQCWGHSETGQAVLLDQIRGKWEAPELVAQARAFWAKHRSDRNLGPLRAFKVEDKVSGTGLIQTLKREGIPMLPVQRPTDKVTRAYDVAPFIESGNAWLPQNAPWLSDYLHEMSTFPNGAHDDQADPTFDAISDMFLSANQRVGILVKKRHRAA